jgi:putative oxidoreductase
MIDAATAPYGMLILRICFGIMFIAHCMLNGLFEIRATVAVFKSIGLPGWLPYFVITVEFAGAVALILGIWPRIVALLLIPMIIATIVKVHGRNGWLFTNKGGGWEYPAFWAAALLVQFLVGDGAWVLVPSPSFQW